MKKTLIVIFFALVGLAPHVLAQGFVPLAPIPNLTSNISPTSALDANTLATFLNNLYKYCIGLAAILAIIEIIWGGIEISTKDSVSQHSDGKSRIYGAIFGLVLVLSPVLVFTIINPSILNLSLNLPPLKTYSGTLINGTPGTGAGTQSTANPGTAAAIAAGCTVTGTLFQTAICPTSQAAQAFAAACATGSGNVPFFTTTNKATCGTESGPITGPYSFADTSQSNGFFGVVNTIVGYSHYDPIASTPSNPNNGNAVMQFASTCTADGGTTCMGTLKLPCSSSVVQLVTGGSSASCWDISLSCTSGSVGAGGCSSNPQFTVVTSK